MQAQTNKYLETKIQTATQEQLLIMLCDGAIRYCKMGIDGINKKNNTTAHVNLMKVQDIVAEFAITLDQTSEIAQPLLHLYEYFIHRLTEANVKKITAPAEEVLESLISLKETWVQAAIISKQQNKPAPIMTHG